jgi:nucleolar GTP-binding protein
MYFPQIYKSNEILDQIINKLKKDKETIKMKNLFNYINKFQFFLIQRYETILSKLPDQKTDQEYYSLVLKNIIPVSELEKYKNHYSATIHIINKLSERFKKKVKKADIKEYPKIKKEYIGRISSVIRKLKTTNSKLLDISKEIRNIPKPDMNAFTIVLIGLPNAGKTTLLTELTKSDPEINTYEFTTKSLNLGYFTKRFEKIQVVDTPGIIHLEFKDMNKIEKYAIVAIKSLADKIVFVYNNRLDLDKQYKIYEKIKEENKNKDIYIYENIGSLDKKYKNPKIISKKDILNLNF